MNRKDPNNRKFKKTEEKIEWDAYTQLAKAELNYEIAKWKVLAKTPFIRRQEEIKEKK